ncbi:outer membrane beta-barrel protein [Pedobacter frigoris]|uniref:outer membrane beta-barrel protein n=1 Tax=Pedobacter frigoris TaxID=2571272 RepID=UPI00292E4033|nr:outer membrane beta-barrel protein [Pedobacter frigoris]
MKKQLFTAAAVLLSVCGYAQTKGTSALGFGINSNSNKYEYSSPGQSTENKSTGTSVSLSYGLFIKDNTKLGIDLTYGEQDQKSGDTEYKTKQYGGNLNYQHYYPIVKSLFAYAGGRAGYTYTETNHTQISTSATEVSGNGYNLGAYGGITWFLSKRFALETRLLSADASYSLMKTKGGYSSGDNQKQTTTNFDLSTQGFIKDLGFKIYLLF